MEFEVTPPEADLLREILARHLGDLRVAIGRTEHLADRQDLQHKEEIIKALIARLDAALASSG